jgi:hypothetical protein
MSDFELLQLTESIGGSHKKIQLLKELQRVRDECEAQVATMRHFDE